MQLETNLAGSEDALSLRDALVEYYKISSPQCLHPVFVFNITTIMAEYGYQSQDQQRRFRNSDQKEIVKELEQLDNVIPQIGINSEMNIRQSEDSSAVVNVDLLFS